MRTKQRLVRTLIEEIVIDVDDATREVVLLIHWRGGQHSELRVRKPVSGEHSKSTSIEADQLIREMVTRWSDADIAATLNRMGLPTGQGNTWTGHRVATYRNKSGIPAYASAANDRQYLTILDAARKLGVSRYMIRVLIRNGILPARQVVVAAPWQIRAEDLGRSEVHQALERRRIRRGRPWRNFRDDRTLTIPGT
jgi:hypothetical protein